MKNKIVAFMLILLLGMIFFIYDGYKSVTSTYKTVSSQVENQQLKTQYLTAMYNAGRERSLILLEMLSENDPFALDEFTQMFGEQAQNFIIARTQLMQLQLNEQEVKFLEIQNAATEKNAPIQNQVAQLLNNDQRDKALSLLFDQAIPAQNEILKVISKLISFDNLASKKLVGKVNQNLSQTGERFSLIMALFFIILFSLIFYIQTTSRTQEKLLRANLAMQEDVSKQMMLSREQLRQFNDALSIFTFMLKPDGTIELINKTAANSVGREPHDFIGVPLTSGEFWLTKDIVALKNGGLGSKTTKLGVS